jgi:hypothetical protein
MSVDAMSDAGRCARCDYRRVDEAATRDSEHVRPRYASRSSVPTARKVTALSQMEQSVRLGSGCSQVVSMKAGRLSTPCVRFLTPQLTYRRVSAVVSSA